MKKASRAKITESSSQKAADKHQAAVNRAMKNPANRSWNKPYNSSYVMKGGIPHKLVDGVFVPFVNVVEKLAKGILPVSKKKKKAAKTIVAAISWMLLMNLTYSI
jgi:hypothetical protein